MPQQPIFSQQPQQLASRRGQGGYMEALLGRELNPSLPPVQEVPLHILFREQEAAQKTGDKERLRNLRMMIEQRSAHLTSAGQFAQPQPEAPPVPPELGVLLNPMRLFERPEFQ